MALLGMNSREKTAIIVLGVIIVVALVGIGVLAAKLIVSDRGDAPTTHVTPAATTTQVMAPQETSTLVANPSLEGEAATPAATGPEPIVVVQVESPGPLLPVVLMDQALHPGRSYRVEIVAADGSKTAIRGSWSHSAKGADGKLELPLPESFEGTTPLRLDLVPPVPNPVSWSLSLSASAKDLLGQPPRLVITVWDVTGSE
jgi:hypothetical protein